MPLSNQEIFELVSHHLLKQGKPSRYKYRSRYLHPDGLMCAVGCLFRIEHYDPIIDSLSEGGHTVCDPRVLKILKNSEVISSHDIRDSSSSRRVALLFELQRVHDYVKPKEWRKALANVSAAFNLDPTILYKEYA